MATTNNNDYLSVKTRGNGNPQGKPRVYFTCHPMDFDGNFEKICEDIFKTQDCAIYYTDDMSAELPEEYREVDLGQMNLFVVPITFRLLTEPNRAMDSDIQFALEQHIAILPIMIENGIDEFYAKKFGKLQYLNPYSQDLTEISYEEKLKKYLAGILFDDKTAEKVRKAFDAYIFLSYRKKDRKYANELMKLIHANPICRDIAIWYDEFLTPGESFSESIEKMLEKSDLFALLVTPNLLELPNGKPNFVMAEEYPAARDMQKPILPAEMVETDKDELKSQFTGISKSVNAKDDAELKDALVKAFSSYAIRENDNDPMHNYLIGLAYLEGIDVEKNNEMAIELITKAAEAELPEAMKKIRQMYYDGYGVELDWNKVLYWSKKIVDYCVEKYGEKDKITLEWINTLAASYFDQGEFPKVLEISKRIYDLRCELLGENNIATIEILGNLAITYKELGDLKKALELGEKEYAQKCELLGEKHPYTLTSLHNLAIMYGALGDFKEKLEIEEGVYANQCDVLGEKHPDTVATLHNLALTHRELGEYKKALEIGEKVYFHQCDVYGSKHPNTLTTLCNLVITYRELGEYKKALEIGEKVYVYQCDILGEKHPDTIGTLDICAVTYAKMGNYKKALELGKMAYNLGCEVQGNKHPNTIIALNNLAYMYGNLGDYKKALELEKEVYALRCDILGEKHPETIGTLGNLAITYRELGEYKKALELEKEVYALRCDILGEKHPETIGTLGNLAITYGELGEYKKELEIEKNVYALMCEIFGKKHPYTLTALSYLADTYCYLQDYEKSILLFELAYSQYYEVCGKKDEDTLNIAANLAKAYFKFGNFESALKYCDVVLNANILLSKESVVQVADVYTTLGYLDKAEQIMRLAE